MTPGLAAMLIGLLGAPVVLLWAGHRMRRRSARWRAAFWGAVIGHVAAALIAMFAGMFPPAAYGPDDVWRGLLGFWLLPLGPIAGAVIGTLARRGDRA